MKLHENNLILFVIAMLHEDMSAILTKSRKYIAALDALGRRLCVVTSETERRSVAIARRLDCARFCMDETGCVAFNVYDNATCDLFTCRSLGHFLAVDSCRASVDVEYKQNTAFGDVFLATARDCSDLANSTTSSGLYRINIKSGSINVNRSVYCDFSYPGQIWLVLQRRNDGCQNFEQTWKEYADGFGNLLEEFWIGNEALYALTNRPTFKYKLRFELEDFDGQKRYAEYSSFKVASSADYYRLSVSGYSGDAGDSFTFHSGCQFSTKDVDRDMVSYSCAQMYHGAWWYKTCYASNLNGAYYLSGNISSYGDGIVWKTFRGFYYSLKFTEMKIARV